MNQRKFSKLEFAMEVLALLLNVVGVVLFGVSYTTGYYTFREMNSPMILSFFLVGIGMEIFSMIAMTKWGDKMWTRFLTFAVTALLVAGAMLLIGDRVEGIGNCIVTDYDSGHGGEEAIYYSLAASGAMLLGTIFNVVGSFCKAPQPNKLEK
nr:hypothetical protein [uncultured Blautia sp.]